MIQGQCARRQSWALIGTKILQLQGDLVTLTPWTLCIHNFQAIVSCLTSGTVEMSLYAVVLLKGGGEVQEILSWGVGIPDNLLHLPPRAGWETCEQLLSSLQLTARNDCVPIPCYRKGDFFYYLDVNICKHSTGN